MFTIIVKWKPKKSLKLLVQTFVWGVCISIAEREVGTIIQWQFYIQTISEYKKNKFVMVHLSAFQLMMIMI